MSIPESHFRALYEQYAADVFRFALHLCGERSEAEDITSETFIRVWTSSKPLEMATVKGYLFAIARNLFLQRLRKRRPTTSLDRDLTGSGMNQEEHMLQAADVDQVMAGLQRLKEIDRAALLMRAVHNLPYEEIARALGISVGSAKVKVHRARLALAGLKTT